MPSSSDPTFSNYTNEQARKYANHRGGYTDLLMKIIVGHHIKTGGSLNTLLDVGCGPGNSTRPLAVEFAQALGLDPGVEMVNTARNTGGETATGQTIKYIVSSAESMTDSIRAEFPSEKPDESVDLITAAMAV